ncbi:hypothetical protein SAMN06295967_104105 [Belliella buryatensis]|uniref:Lipoprotein n=1 Tax=Belliella buryatensis TaxID=1500549 RepID=A0A239C8E9_9BACT|nr:hypothetical protein [Belliella buryatensis]SNS15653.1 hypothetical protein SAMN06295967_104105 [Belliella buryatensis]
MKKILILLFSTFFLVGCSNQPIKIKVEEIKDDIVRIIIKNETEIDYEKIAIIIDYLGDKKEIIKVDTVSYKMDTLSDCGSCVFLKSNESTFIVQKVPSGTKFIKARYYSSE